ncbi:MAG TPA: helicase-associated domain-containing protein [Candidatus Hydrogenedentes bacterium]|nr:helicase-associated domain-containing protein [Candidatus Hydrogenedentota bacterium]HOV74326.1 helicase-associated domain-containing protein [Candidatus Hydrogenedentota bacterium]HPC14981.1 helicase-associated domain-containing protein [Candidatus Hydrogenedentota bacterium]HRT19158.1 helicase-associated domain-containing protein [Candidatus Hydrogenedentota bacterium]HRT64087.1 helicase-associated domain-containing protein [Candidatus Hydrogenedentota bacterium]
MRHTASMVAAMEGISRPAFLIARELANNSRSGLTVRFLSKKLDLPEEEVEYLVDINHKFLFTDLTKIKIVSEGLNAVGRITVGLENHGDIPSLFRYVKLLGPQEFRHLEEFLDLESPCTKKELVESLVARAYQHPDSVITYVATGGFSHTAREVFDIVWNSKEGVMPVSKIRAAHGGSEYEVEQALWELFRGMALFEMFRFDAEDRLVRVAGLLSEIRQYRESLGHIAGQKARPKAHRGTPAFVESNGLRFTDMICRLVAALAARPARLRSDGELFREDRRRLADICPEETEPSLNTCLWAAQGVGWLARVDNELRAGELEPLLSLGPIERHRILCDWLLSSDTESCPRRLIARIMEELRPGTWYSVIEVARFGLAIQSEDDQPLLKCAGAHWHYASPGALSHSERSLVHALETALVWLGLVDRAEEDAESVFMLTALGEHILLERPPDGLEGLFSQHDATIVVQPNFDVVVPTQDMDPLLTVPLDQFAVRSSVGQATVYHLEKNQFTRAIQEGHDANAFVEFLIAHNRGGALPSNVMTTLEDWRGGMKRVRLRTLHVVESDDALVLADLLHRRRFRKFLSPVESHRVAVYAKIDKAELEKLLEKDGFIVE